jgi:hypothetical protein
LYCIIKFHLWRVIPIEVWVLHLDEESLSLLLLNLVLELLLGNRRNNISGIDTQGLLILD